MTVQFPRPNSKPQTEFFKAKARFIAYGGARGGGKSWSVRYKAALLATRYAGIRILVLRRTFPELQENHILPMRAILNNVATYKEVEKAFNFPNGSRIKFGYCASEGDVNQYQGQEYDIIFIDEATHFTEYQFSALTACLRGANDFPKRMYLTCNPGGVGHMWVKRLFVDRAFKETEDPDDYIFIQAKATDNPALVEKDPGYLRMLDNLPPGTREAWRDGDWNVFMGQYFPEFREEIHVVQPRAIPKSWPRYRVIDYGLDMLACYWAAIDQSGRIWVYREFCQSGLIVSDAARAMLQYTQEGENIQYTIAPPDLWNTQKDTGRSMAELFNLNGVPLVKASNQRVQGWMVMKEYLKLREDGKPGLVVWPECSQFIRDVKAVQHDEKNPADVATEPHEYTHTVDAMRYLCVFRAMGAEVVQTVDEEENELVGYDDFMTGGEMSDSYLIYGG